MVDIVVDDVIDYYFNNLITELYHLILDTDNKIDGEYNMKEIVADVEGFMSNLINFSIKKGFNVERIKNEVDSKPSSSLINKDAAFEYSLNLIQDSIISNYKEIRYIYKYNNINLNGSLERRIKSLIIDLKTLCDLYKISFDDICGDIFIQQKN